VTRIDQPCRELYGLTDDEICIVEESDEIVVVTVYTYYFGEA